VYYFDLSILIKNSILARGIFDRTYLTLTDGVVFVGNAQEINNLVEKYLYSSHLNNSKSGEKNRFFGKPEYEGATPSSMSGGATVLADNGYEYSIYGIHTNEEYNLGQIVNDMYIGRGVVHEWTHQIMDNTFRTVEIGSGHTDDTDVKRYSYGWNIDGEIDKKMNMMINGDEWEAKDYPNPKFTDPLFKYLSTDVKILKQILNKNKPAVQTEKMKTVRAKAAVKTSNQITKKLK
jgi:hypothetical protein